MRDWIRSSLVLALASSLVLAGCGTDDGEKTANTTTDTAGAADASGGDDATTGGDDTTTGADTGASDTAGADAGSDAATGPGSLAQVATEAGTFKTLLAAAKAAGLDGALAAAGPFTVFAPTDDAFAKLPAGTVDDLLKPENKDKLTAVLTYHVVEGKVAAADVKTGKVKTLSGLELDVVAEGGKVTVNGVSVTQPDVMASNGIIHVIDTVLLPPAPAPGTIVAEADKAGTFKTLLAAAKAAGLDTVLAGEGPFTVFAPNDDAFAKIPKEDIDELLKPENKEILAAVLKHHVVPAKVVEADVKAGVVASVNGTSITIGIDGGKVTVDGANVTATDVMASNGVIHVIDAVILPPDLVQLATLQPNLKTLVSAVVAAGLVETLEGDGPFTIFAPTDDAFAKVDKAALDELLKPENKEKLTAVLLFHVLAGAEVMAADVKAGEVETAGKQKLTIAIDAGVVKVDVATVTATDLVAINGVIHLIDSVIFPPAPMPGTIVAEADKAGTFKTLLAAAKAAGLDTVLAGEGPFTVFAPTDDAFAKLPAGTVDDLLKPENKDALAAILKHHVVPAKVVAADVKAGVVASVNGTSITIAVDGGKVMVDGASVTATDVMASNGVIHVIDAVILPPDLVQLATLQPNLKTLVSAVVAAGLVETLKGTGPFTVFAPTDDAFAKVDKAALDNLLKPENKAQLTAVLLFHVLAGKVMAADVKAGEVDTAGKQKLKITIDAGVVKVDVATVIATDIVATNGVVHLIDSVIFPPAG